MCLAPSKEILLDANSSEFNKNEEKNENLTFEEKAECESDQYDFKLSDDEGDDSTSEIDDSSIKPNSLKVNKSENLKCDECGKILSSKGNLKKHKVLHLSDKPWKCNECNLTFNQARDLNTHKMQKHTNERPHVCKVRNWNVSK